MKRLQKGLTLVEMLVSLVLSLSLVLILIQLHVHSRLMSEKQQALSRQLESTAALVHILSHSLRDALYHIVVSENAAFESDYTESLISEDICRGISLGEQCLPPVSSWLAGEPGTSPVAGAQTQSAVLLLKQSCCEEWLAEQFYLAHRGGDEANPLSLYRRRMRSDGSFTPAAELVEDVTDLSYQFVTMLTVTGELSMVGSESINNWWSVKAVRVHAVVASRTISFTISSRHRQLRIAATQANDNTLYATI